MKAEHESNRARSYLLDEVSEEERSALEQEYFGDAKALERMEAAEEGLIEDYLAERLDYMEHTRFERSYLTVPHRRRRVDTIRALMAAAEPRRRASSSTPYRAISWVSLAAAALLVLVLGGWWVLRTRHVPNPPGPLTTVPPAPQTAAVAPPAPRILAFSISSISVRSPGDRPTLVIPPGTDIVRLRLEAAAGQARVEDARARVRTVTGTEIWRGPAVATTDAPAGTIAQIDVPAARLPVDDYVVELFGLDARGVERERARYFLSVRLR